MAPILETAITRAEVDSWLAMLNRQGVGSRARQMALQVLNVMLNRAVAWEKLAANPASQAEKPKHRSQPVRPPTPQEVEYVRAALGARDRMGDATLVSTLAYAGLRPQEALCLHWADIGDRTVLVRPEGKTGSRAVRLLAPLAKDLAEWKLACGGRWELVFPNRHGEQWTESGWGNWRGRVWYGTDEDPGVAHGMGIKPYALRHTFVSLLIREGLSVVEVAQQAGHSPAVCLKTYAHVMEELAGSGSAEGEIRKARQGPQREAMCR